MKGLMIGDMMDVFDKVDHFIICVTSNLKRETNELIMLNGLAGALGTKYPTLPKKMGDWIKENHGDCGIFWLRVSGKVGILQHMILPRNGTNLGLVSKGIDKLAELASANPTKTYALEWPGYNDPVWMYEGILAKLPDNVQVWKPVP